MRTKTSYKKGHKGYWKGKKHTEAMKQTKSRIIKKKIADGWVNPMLMKGRAPWNKGKKTGIVPPCAFKKGQRAWNALNRTLEELREKRRKYRKDNPLMFKAYDHRKRAKRKDLTKKTIQMVYEDNIKKHGTLTCYLCLEPIELGQDSLEHKTPISRGGTNQYDNLEIACIKCNMKKNRKTVDEYLKTHRRR